MPEHRVATELGELAVASRGPNNAPVLVFLHGIFLDRHIWDASDEALATRRRIVVDMPGHGASSPIGRAFDLDDCATALIDVLDALGVSRCVVVGHSWGGMSALRAAHAHPERFTALALFNTPFQPARGRARLGFQLQKTLVGLRRFYAGRLAKAVYARQSLRQRPRLISEMQDRLAAMAPREIARVIDAVLLRPGDATPVIDALRVPALAIVGGSDFVGTPPRIETIIAPGGHVTPQEAPAETRAAVARAAALGIPRAL